MKKSALIKLSLLALSLVAMVVLYEVMREAYRLIPEQGSRRSRKGGSSAQAQGAEKPLSKPLPNPKILIIKSKRTLFLYSDNKIVRRYHIGLGFKPTGDKIKEGDGRTPEGKYYICTKNPKSRYYLSLGLNYPNEQDADRGLKAGLINQSQYERIINATRNKSVPPWDTPLGGEIFIHGHGAHSDWTLGCITMENEDVKELYEAVGLGTRVVILP